MSLSGLLFVTERVDPRFEWGGGYCDKHDSKTSFSTAVVTFSSLLAADSNNFTEKRHLTITLSVTLLFIITTVLLCE